MSQHSESRNGAAQWLKAELQDALDEDYELELSETVLSLLGTICQGAA